MVAPATEPSRTRTPWTWVGALMLLGTLSAGLIGAAVLLWRFIDIDSLLEANDDTPPPFVQPVAELRLPNLPEPVAWHAVDYRSPTTAAFFPDTSYYSSLVARWDGLLSDAGAVVGHVSDIDALDLVDRSDLLVIPAAVCLTDAERDAIRRRADTGGHLLATWALGARDAECEWTGYEFLRRLARVGAAGTMEGRPPTYVTVPHGNALAAGLPPGARIELKSEPWVAVRSSSTSAFWSDRSLNPLAAPEGGAAGAAFAHRTSGGSRFVWFGYRLDVAARSTDQRLVDRLAQNGALWGAGHTTAEVDPWPDGYHAAMAVTEDVEHSFKNSQRLAERMKAIDAPITFFVVTQLALAYPELAGSLAAAGELGSHSVDHRQIAGRSWIMQLSNATQARADIQQWAAVPALGLRPPRELFDIATLETWRRSGGTYVAASNDARSVVPEIFEVSAGRIVVLPRVVDDDYTVMIIRHEMSKDSVSAALLGGLEKVRSLGGLNLLTVHSQLVDSDRRVDAVEAAVAAARRTGDVWIATAGDIADWWLNRSLIELHARERDDRSVILTVHNSGSEPLAAVWLHLHLPEARSTYAAPEIGDVIPESHFIPGGLRVRLPLLRPNETVTVLLPRHSS